MSLNRHAVRVRLRDGRTLDGHVHMTDGQALSTFLSTKVAFLNLTDATDAHGDGERVPHLSVRLVEIVWVQPLDPGLQLSSALQPSVEAREVELHAVSGGEPVRLRVRMNVAKETRMSDYLDAHTGFIPLWSVQVGASPTPLDRVALNHGAITMIRELADTDPRRMS